MNTLLSLVWFCTTAITPLNQQPAAVTSEELARCASDGMIFLRNWGCKIQEQKQFPSYVRSPIGFYSYANIAVKSTNCVNHEVVRVNFPSGKFELSTRCPRGFSMVSADGASVEFNDSSYGNTMCVKSGSNLLR